MTAFDHANANFSENMFNAHDPILSPTTSHHNTQPFSNTNGIRSSIRSNNVVSGQSEEMLSPLLDLSEHDTCFDNTSQSLLNSNKVHLANR